MNPFVLLKDFTFLGDSGQSWSTDWVRFPAEFAKAQLVVVVKSRIGSSGIFVVLESTWDTDDVTSAVTVPANAPGTNIGDTPDDLGPMIRLTLTANANSQLVFSTYLTPKSE